MASELDYKRLRDLAREEKAQPGLVAISEDFYPSVEAFLSSRFSEMEASRSVLQMREFENAVATIKEISSIRQQKILFKAIRNGGVHGKTGEMTREEHELYDRFSAVIGEEKERLAGMLARFESRPRAHGAEKQAPGPEATAQEQGSRLKKVRFTKDVPAYKGANSQTFGPYRKGEEGALPHEEAEWLLKGKLAEPAE